MLQDKRADIFFNEQEARKLQEKNIKKKQMKILQFKNTIAEIENSLDGLNCSKIEIREERISKCDDVNYLAVQKREIKFKKRALSTYMIVPKELAFMLSQFQKQRRVQGRKKNM